MVLLSLDKQEDVFSLSMTHRLVSYYIVYYRFKHTELVGRREEMGRCFL